MKAFARNMVPEAFRLLIAHHCQAIGKPGHPEPMNPTVNHWCQTDTTIARSSKCDEIRFASQLSLDDVMIDHLWNQDGSPLPIAFEHEKLNVILQLCAGK